MNRDAIFNKVVEILNQTFEIPIEDIKMESSIQDDLDMDSIDAVDLIVQIQSYTNKNIDPEDFKQVRTIEDIILAIEKVLLEDSTKEN